MNLTLERWNAATHEQAVEDILPCNGSPAWATQIAALRPFATAFELTCAADIIWRSLPRHDWQQAFDSHPRIGEQTAKSATAESLKLSAGEQAAANPNERAKTALAEGNRAYEQKFGRIFIVCATGKSAAEMLAILEHRMSNDPATDLREAAEQQRQITQIRLRKWLGMAI
jgi:2-oxo-4-hydroxy-4-carboxy-5-ureidoimidazoline decarboxylase